jgi:uncharacterized protein (DUF1697 family)
MRYAAFLRAVNLGRNRRVSGADLCAIFEEVGLEEVSSFQTSGNMVFEAPRDMSRQIEQALESTLGYEVAIFLRSAAEVQAIAAHEPFPAELQASMGKLQLWLLGEKPTAAVRRKVLAHATDEDRLAFGERELYWLPSGTTAESALDTVPIGKLIGPTTQRTKGTIERLAAKFFA